MKLYLIDGHAVTYRQFYALNAAAFSTHKGEATHAVYGFARLLLDVLYIEKPDYLAVSFDMGLSGRDVLYTEYKGTRAALEEAAQADFDNQLARIQQLVTAFNIPILAVDGWEADDVIGTAAEQAEKLGVEVRIITGDRDILQLLTPQVEVQLPSRGKPGSQPLPDKIWTVEMFREEYGFEPVYLVDYKALVGDTSDNIPGVAGIGDVTAKKLLTAFGTLDNLYANLDKIDSKAVLNKLQAGRDSAVLSYQLAQIRKDAPINLELEKCVAHDYDGRIVFDLFRELEFRSLFKRLPKEKLGDVEPELLGTPSPGAKTGVSQMDQPQGEAAALQMQTVIVDDAESLRALVEVLNNASVIAFDTETTSLDQMRAELVGISLAVDGQTGYYIPVGHGGKPADASGQMMLMFDAPSEAVKQLSLQTVLDALRPALTNPSIPKVAHNAAYDLVVLQRYDIDVAPITFDTMIAEWVRDPGSRFLGLKGLARQLLSINMTEISELIGTGKKQRTMDQLPVEQVAPYAAADAAITLRLTAPLDEELRKTELFSLFSDLEMPLIPVISAMERAGVLIDVEELQRQSVVLDTMLTTKASEIYAIAGETFNINSPKQLNDVLFEKLKLPVAGIAKTTHGYSTSADVLEALQTQDEHGIVGKILEYREVAKLKSTYVDALPQLVNPATGRVHTSFNQTGSSTGRMSSSNPNLQNIPIRTEFSRAVRRAFIAPQGYRLLSADYSQVELRILAHITKEPTLLEAFQQGQDIHAATAAAVYGVPLESVTYEQRSFAKRVNFGLLYGMGAYRLTRDSDLTLAESRQFIDTYFERLPGVKRYHEETKREVRQPPYCVRTLLGRRRYFPIFGEHRANQTLIATAEREAINMPVQGTAADIIKRAMIDLYAELGKRKSGARILLQVHDELLLEVPESELRATRDLVVQTMESAFELDAPLKANAQAGQNWHEMEKISG
jgi:DNA polymerase I